MSDPTPPAPQERPPLVSIVDLGKEYVKYEDTPILLSSILRMRSKTRRSRLWAVRHVDFELAAGEALGVIGRNGSGKSTMLRMLAGVTAPSEGSLEVRGHVAPLISVGVGFHQELTGRENVYVNGTVLGMTREQIEERFDDIVAFAEIGDFLDTPVKFYSSGMFVRLGFSVAVASAPDLLLVDEVLAVGDIGFQVKCFRRMDEMREEGSSTIVVSHNLGAVRNMCPRTLVLSEGKPVFLGPTDDAISIYHELVAESKSREAGLGGRAEVEIADFHLVNEGGGRTSHIEGGQDIAFRLRVKCNVGVKAPAFSITVSTEAGMPIYGDTNWHSITDESYDAGEELVCEVRLPARLATGSYTATAGVMWDHDPDKQLSTKPVVFYVSGREMVHGIVDLGASFDVERALPTPQSDDTAHS